MVLFCFLKLFILFWGWGSHRREARRKLQSLVQIELYRKRYLPGQFPCQKGKENPLAIMHRLHYVSQRPAFWSASPVTDMPGLSGCIM